MKLLTPNFTCYRSVSSSPPSKVQFSPFKIPGTNCDFVQCIPTSTISRAVNEGSDNEDSVFSISSEDLLPGDDLCTGETEAQREEGEE